MTTVTFHMEGDRLTGFDSQGHSGYAEEGADIVCAAVKVNEREASITLRLPGGLASDAESTCQNLLTGLMVYLAQLHDEYPDNIEVMEA